MRINHNIAALNTHRQLGNAQNGQMNSMEKLASGLRINKAGDDAAGLAISEKMRGQIRGLDMAQKNAQDGISMIQTAEGSLNESQSILQRMRELAVQSANDTNTESDRGELQKEVNQLAEELTRIADNTEFNTQNLLDGSFEGTFQIGANANQNLSISIDAMGSEALKVAGFAAGEAVDSGNVSIANLTGEEITVQYADLGTEAVSETTAVFDEDSNTITVTLKQDAGADATTAATATTATQGEVATALAATGKVTATPTTADTAFTATTADATIAASTVYDTSKGIDISSQGAANSAIETIQTAIDSVSAERSKLGAVQNRLDHTINNLGTSSENLTAAESRIRDVDMAKEMMNQTKNSILAQASQAMLAQANQQPQGVLQLLQ
ncbi:flagellin N-terminal helical domain-containing protein [Virgibacillus sediminis]|uniref:Flagellin n=1 Tax=Virgibacillus sediminis TaxID=202260 RepID=A0ABV7A8M7_9BACI